jgi:hypothetical protein
MLQQVVIKQCGNCFHPSFQPLLGHAEQHFLHCNMPLEFSFVWHRPRTRPACLCKECFVLCSHKYGTSRAFRCRHPLHVMCSIARVTDMQACFTSHRVKSACQFNMCQQYTDNTVRQLASTLHPLLGCSRCTKGEPGNPRQDLGQRGTMLSIFVANSKCWQGAPNICSVLALQSRLAILMPYFVCDLGLLNSCKLLLSEGRKEYGGD